jgi:hypothetical protein
MFVSTFHDTKSTMGAAWKMPLVDDFIESLTCEKYKLAQMGSLMSSKAHALVENKKSSSKFKQKCKGKKDPDPKKDKNPNST